MERQAAFFLVTPENIQGENIRNAHVFDGLHEIASGKWFFTSDSSRCGKVYMEEEGVSTVRNINDKDFCRELINGHNIEYDVCGLCMATFFSDDDNDDD